MLQDAQVTIECVIEQKHHRNVLGMKGSNVQAITQEHNVSIKFPERGSSKAAPPAATAEEEGEEEERAVNGEQEEEDTAWSHMNRRGM